jgi:hypothetical protein
MGMFPIPIMDKMNGTPLRTDLDLDLEEKSASFLRDLCSRRGAHGYWRLIVFSGVVDVMEALLLPLVGCGTGNRRTSPVDVCGTHHAPASSALVLLQLLRLHSSPANW